MQYMTEGTVPETRMQTATVYFWYQSIICVCHM
jgi:hypothetical protein